MPSRWLLLLGCGTLGICLPFGAPHPQPGLSATAHRSASVAVAVNTAPVPEPPIRSLAPSPPETGPQTGRRADSAPAAPKLRAGESPHSDAGLALPVRFEKNVGQAGPHVDAIARARGYTLTTANRDGVLTITTAPDRVETGDTRGLPIIQLAGTTQSAEISFLDDQAGVSNYLIGSDPSNWRVNVPGYSRLKYTGLYPHIDVVLYGNPGELEYDFVVEPGGDPSVITFAFPGADRAHVDEDGALVVRAGAIDVRQKRPEVYQEGRDGARRPIDGRYAIAGNAARIVVGEYDRAQPLVIDPVLLVYSTYIGGAGSGETASGLAVDAAGSAYITGQTYSWWYPVANPLQPFHSGWPPPPPPPPFSPYDVQWWAHDPDLVISKFAPDGSSLMFSTYIGGASEDVAWAIAVDDAGEVVVMGSSSSPDFPSGPGYQFGCPCPTGFFLLKLDPSGTALTYVSRMRLWPAALAVDGVGNAYLAGSINGPAAGDDPYIPIVNAAQPQFGGGSSDAYLLAMNATGTALLYSTYLGGEGNDAAWAVAVLADGRPGVAGWTASTVFPMLGADAPRSGGPFNTFVTRFAADGAMQQSHFLAGPFTLTTGSPTFGADGSLYVVGTTADDGFPVVNAMQPLRAGQHDGWIVKYATSGAVVYSTYIGGPWPDIVAGVASDAQGRAYVLLKTLVNWTGERSSIDGYPDEPTNNWDIAVVKLHSSGEVANAIALGGSDNDSAARVAAQGAGDVYLLGTSYSYDFPLVRAFMSRTSSVFSARIDPHPMDMILVRMSMRMGAWPVTEAVPPGTAQRLTLFGEEFFGAMAVSIGGQSATDLVVHDRHAMSLTVPALPAGIYDLVVRNSYGEVVTEPNAIVYGSCTFHVSSEEERFLASGGTRTLSVSASAPICGWTAESPVGWVALAGPTGVGSAGVSISVQPNTSTSARSATITIAGQEMTIRQAPAARFDIDGDGFTDLLWRHQSDGRLAAWTMSGATEIGGSALSPPGVEDLEWTIAGTGDFDGDGRQDLVWQHGGDGRVAVWLMDGLSLREGGLIATVPELQWRIGAVGDLNADGSPDLIWQHRTLGLAAVWLMDGLRCASGELIDAPAVPATEWEIVGAGDFTGPDLYSPADGHLDILWQHVGDDRAAIWTMEGTRMTGGREIEWYENWRIHAVADISDDGALDFVVQHDTTGELRYIRYDPLVPTGSTIHPIYPSFVDDLNWRIVGPR